MAIDGHIVGGIIDEAGEAVSASWDVDGLEKVGEHFAEMLDVVIRRLADDGGIVDHELTKEVLDIIQCGHDVQRKGVNLR